MITIVSRDRSHCAHVTPTEEGIVVTLRRVHPPRKRLGVWVLEKPLHVVLDHVHDLLRPLAVEGPLKVYDHHLKKVVTVSDTQARKIERDAYSRSNPATRETRETREARKTARKE